TQRPLPLIEGRHGARPPEPLLVPEPLCAVDRGKQRPNRPDAASGDDVQLDSGFTQRPEHAGMVSAGRPSPGEDERCPKLRRIVVRRPGDHPRASSWMVRSLTISNSRVPPGVDTLTVSPGSLLRNARPMGDVVEIRPLVASASSGMTS